MDQQNPSKPVMDVTPPKPVAQPPQAPAEQTAADSTRATAPEPQAKESLTVHTAPPLSDDDRADAAQQEQAGATTQPKPEKQVAHTTQPKPRGPGLAIFAVVFAMAGLAALAILVYLNS